jgi:hypothetical protein
MTNPINPNQNQDIDQNIDIHKMSDEQLANIAQVVVPSKFAGQNPDLWFGIYSLIKYMRETTELDEETELEILEQFGEIPDDLKSKWLGDYIEHFDKNQTLNAVAIANYKERLDNEFIDTITDSLTLDQVEQFVQITFKDGVPAEITEKIEEAKRNSQTNSQQDILSAVSKYRENGINLSSSDKRASFTNTPSSPLGKDELAVLLDRVTAMQEDVNKIPVNEYNNGGLKEENPFEVLGNKVSSIIDSTSTKLIPQNPKVQPLTGNNNQQNLSTTQNVLPVRQPINLINHGGQLPPRSQPLPLQNQSNNPNQPHQNTSVLQSLRNQRQTQVTRQDQSPNIETVIPLQEEQKIVNPNSVQQKLRDAIANQNKLN